MNSDRRLLLGIILVLGSAVPASYVHGLVTHPATRGSIWGGVPEALQPLYTVNMFLAAAGFFFFTYFVLFRVEPKATNARVGFGYAAFSVLYTLILLPSALWLPLTFRMVESPSDGLWWGIRVVLWLVGVGSLGVAWLIWRLKPSPPSVAWRLAVLGCIPFSVQTAILDALVWPALYPR